MENQIVKLTEQLNELADLIQKLDRQGLMPQLRLKLGARLIAKLQELDGLLP